MEVELINGTDNPDRLVCLCARGDYRTDPITSDVSYEEVMASVDGETIEEKTRNLLSHLLRSGHYGPFEHPSATFSVQGLSRSCMAQITRHRHASFDVRSFRYTEIGDDPEEVFCYPPSLTADEIVSRDGVSESDVPPAERRAIAEGAYEACLDAYHRLLDAGVPPEDARMVIPQGALTNLTFTMNARMLMHLLAVRSKADSQWEIRQLTDQVLDRAREWAPITFELFERKLPMELNP